MSARITAAALIIVCQLAVLSSVLDRAPGASVQACVLVVQAACGLVALALGFVRRPAS